MSRRSRGKLVVRERRGVRTCALTSRSGRLVVIHDDGRGRHSVRPSTVDPDTGRRDG